MTFININDQILRFWLWFSSVRCMHSKYWKHTRICTGTLYAHAYWDVADTSIGVNTCPSDMARHSLSGDYLKDVIAGIWPQCCLTLPVLVQAREAIKKGHHLAHHLVAGVTVTSGSQMAIRMVMMKFRHYLPPFPYLDYMSRTLGEG